MDKTRVERVLATAERHIVETERRIAAQRMRIVALSAQGASTDDSLLLLSELYRALENHRADRDRWAAELASSE